MSTIHGTDCDGRGHWHDRHTRAELAAALDALGDQAPVLALAATALRNGDSSDELAAALDDHAHTIAMRLGDYDGHALLADAAEALRPSVEPDTITGTFRALRSAVVGGVAVTEYAERPTARYVSVGHGRDEPPELVRVYVPDPDEQGNDDWHAERDA